MRRSMGTIIAGIAVVLTGLVPAAGADIGVLRKLEICGNHGHWDSPGGVAVLANGEVLTIDGVPDAAGNYGRIVRFSATGQPLGFVHVTGLPADVKIRSDMLIDRGAAGTFYLTAPTDRRIFEVRTSGATGQVVRELLPSFGSWLNPYGLVASPSNGGVLYILDNGTRITVSKLDTGEPQFEVTANADAITAAGGAIVAGGSNSDGTRGTLDYYFARQGSLDDPIRKQLDFGAFDVAAGTGGINNTIWALSASEVVHLTAVGNVIERANIGLDLGHHLDGRDGTVWVTRPGELLHLGSGGTKIEPSGYHSSGEANCGPPRLRASYAKVQQIFEKRRLELDARCGETCTVTVTGRLRAPAGNRKTYRLTAGRVRLVGAGSGKLPLRFPPPALNALRVALAKKGATARIDATIVATDTNRNTVRSKRSLVLSR
jgi:hypothetical protein